MSAVERKYSQFERVALAVKWGCEKFYLYLYGIDFEIYTDYKPLVTVLGPQSKPPSPRIERWLLYMEQFKYTIRHIHGKENPADSLSRIPVGEVAKEFVRETEEYLLLYYPRQVEKESAISSSSPDYW